MAFTEEQVQRFQNSTELLAMTIEMYPAALVLREGLLDGEQRVGVLAVSKSSLPQDLQARVGSDDALVAVFVDPDLFKRLSPADVAEVA